MLMAVKNQLKVTLLSMKYGLMKEMLNKATFIMNIVFMILNNAAFIVQWIIIYSLKSNVGGYSFRQILMVWGLAAGSYGFSHFFFKRVYALSDMITNGKLDSYIVQPKNILLSAITSDVDPSAIGDMIYAIIMMIISGLIIPDCLLFVLFCILGGIILTDIAIIYGSLSFWLNRADMLAYIGNGLITHFATYPEGIFEGIAKALLYTIIPVGITNYIPVQVMTHFDFGLTILVIGITAIWTALAWIIFYRGLRRYSSSNLMMAKI